jgi:hypothetical protein
MSSNKEFFESLDKQYYDKNRHKYDRIRWFIFAQEQMTKKQLIYYYEDICGAGSLNYNALKEDLKEEINYSLARHHSYYWNQVIDRTENFWKNGTLNYNPDWTTTEPYWLDYDYSETIPLITDSVNIEQNDYYQRLIKYSYSRDGSPKELKKILPRTKQQQILPSIVDGIGFWVSWIGSIAFVFYLLYILA